MSKPTAIVTGGAGVIGKAIGTALRDAGWPVMLLDFSEKLETVASEAGVGFRHCDITDSEQCRTAIESCDAPGALVNCAGIAALIPFMDLDIETWRRFLDVNLTAPLQLAKLVTPRMAELGGGSIVNITSISGLRAGYGRTAYGTSKAALGHLTCQMALELAPSGIRCNAVAPGPVESEMARVHYTDETRNEYLVAIPQNRFAMPEEVADAVVFLCSEGAAHITGHCLTVDGGFSSAGIGVTHARKPVAKAPDEA